MTNPMIANPPFCVAQRSMRKLLGALLLAMVMLMSTAGLAAADNPNVDVKFKELRVYKKKGDVMLDYGISKKTWRALRDVSIEPRLNIYTPNKSGRYVYRYSVPLKDRKGRILYNKRDVELRRGTDLVKVELVGYNGAHRVGTISFDTQCDDFLNIDVERRGGTSTGGGHSGGGHGGGRDHGDHHDDHHEDSRPSRADVIKACDRHTSYSSELDGCVEVGMTLPFTRNADRVIDACGEATNYGSGLNRCLEQAAKLVGRPVTAIKACDAATTYDSEVKSCLKKAVEFNHSSAGEVIAACDAHTSYSSELNSCVDAASALRRDHVAIVNACGDATSYGSELKRCIQKAAR